MEWIIEYRPIMEPEIELLLDELCDHQRYLAHTKTINGDDNWPKLSVPRGKESYSLALAQLVTLWNQGLVGNTWSYFVGSRGFGTVIDDRTITLVEQIIGKNKELHDRNSSEGSLPVTITSKSGMETQTATTTAFQTCTKTEPSFSRNQ